MDRYDEEYFQQFENYSDDDLEMYDDNEGELTIYKQIARDALMSWNDLTEEEATQKVQESSNEELEQQVGAEGSINNALKGFQKYSQEYFKNIYGAGQPISEHDIELFKEVIMTGKYRNGPVRDFYYIMMQKIGFDGDFTRTKELVLSILSTIHDGWVKDNAKLFFTKKADRGQQFQYLPLELIGWEEVKSDLVFLRPILKDMGLDLFTEEELESAYNERVQAFLKERGISNADELTEQISRGAEFYPALEGQEDIIEALHDTKFVKEKVVSGIRDKGIGTNESISQQLFAEKVVEGADELESLRARKKELLEELDKINEAEKLIEAKENKGQNLDEQGE